MTFRSRLAVIIAALAILVSCAAIPLKQKISTGHQTARQALVIFDEAERDLCRPVAPAMGHCTNPQAAILGLTDEKHRTLSRELADAFLKDAAVGDAMQLWRAGDPMPPSLTQLLSDAQSAQLIATDLGLPSGLLTKAQTFLARVQELASLFQR